jgi:DNA adenine methylase
MKPLFKWSGGKTKEIGKIVPLLPKQYDEYYEPFIGGGALWFHLMPGASHINDNYKAVANFYSVLKQDPNKVDQSSKLNS